MNFYHLKLDLYPSPPLQSDQPQPHPPAAAPSTTATAPFKTQQGHGPAQELTIRFQTLFKPFPQQSHQQRSNLPPQRTTLNPSSAQIRNSEQETSIGSTLSHPNDDYRFGPISVASLDQFKATPASVVKEKSSTTSVTTNTTITNINSNTKNRTTKHKKMSPSTTTASAAAATTTNTSDPRSTGFRDSEPAQGILRLYRDTNEITTGEITATTGRDQETTSTTTSTSYSAALSAGTDNLDVQPLATGAGAQEHGTQIIQPDQGTSVCVLAVPSYLSPGDFLNFVGPVRPNVSHFRIIR